MVILIAVTATLSAALHVVFFSWESIGWTRPAVWKRFGLASQEEAEITRVLAYNQGYYNLFLAIGALLGAILYGAGLHEAGLGIGLFSMASMVAAAIVLLSSGPGRIPAALLQGGLPLITIVLYVVSWITNTR